ncbi:hypothetical protein ACO2Q0_20930 [Phenylobacterium sp. VNQ135]|uniref:hypothetical protein n=1 Tax=Phenylobacterium sp. VNQ135 TaxID=3400922 RepID=UPI003BFCF2A3
MNIGNDIADHGPQPADELSLALPIGGGALRLCRDATGVARAKRAHGPGGPLMVLSIPKAGTYLIAAWLEALGWVDTELHLSNFTLMDYRGLSLAAKRAGQGRECYVPVCTSAGFIGRGQFAVGHVKPEPWAQQAFKDTTRLFLMRDLAYATLSHLRFLIATGRGAPSAAWRSMPASPRQALAFLEEEGQRLFEDEYGPMCGWLDEDLTVVAFEDLVTMRAGPRLGSLEALLAKESGLPLEIVRQRLTSVIGRETKTYSGETTRISQWWNEEVRQRFVRLGLNDLHSKLGYSIY